MVVTKSRKSKSLKSKKFRNKKTKKVGKMRGGSNNNFGGFGKNSNLQFSNPNAYNPQVKGLGPGPLRILPNRTNTGLQSGKSFGLGNRLGALSGAKHGQITNSPKGNYGVAIRDNSKGTNARTAKTFGRRSGKNVTVEPSSTKMAKAAARLQT